MKRYGGVRQIVGESAATAILRNRDQEQVLGRLVRNDVDQRTATRARGQGGQVETFILADEVALLFRTGNGNVRDLGALDFDRTGRVLEFEVELENGFTKIEFDH